MWSFRCLREPTQDSLRRGAFLRRGRLLKAICCLSIISSFPGIYWKEKAAHCPCKPCADMSTVNEATELYTYLSTYKYTYMWHSKLNCCFMQKLRRGAILHKDPGHFLPLFLSKYIISRIFCISQFYPVSNSLRPLRWHSKSLPGGGEGKISL